jgi:hypothetical protein
MLQHLRRARLITRMVLVWFALTIGIAVAAPLVQPESLQLVCSGSGAMKLLVQGQGGEDAGAVALHVLDCPLCMSLDGPPRVAVLPVLPLAASSPSAQALPAAPVALATAAPPPARGPPLLTIQ